MFLKIKIKVFRFKEMITLRLLTQNIHFKVRLKNKIFLLRILVVEILILRFSTLLLIYTGLRIYLP